MMKIKTLYLFAFAIMMVGIISCSDDNPVRNTGPDPKVGEVYVPDEAYRYIGYGYDILGNYADPKQMKGLVFKSWALPDVYTVKRKLENGIFRTVSGSTITEYQNSLQRDITVEGNYKMFSGSVRSSFNSNYYENKHSSFSTVQNIIDKYSITVVPNYANAEDLRPYMDEKAVKDLNDPAISPEDIFLKYGTHVLTGAVMGARLDMNVTMSSTAVQQSQSIDILAKAEYSGLFTKVSGSTGFKNETEKNYYMEHRERTILIHGGKSEYGSEILTQNEYKNWLKTIDKNPVFCDYTDNGLIPIWNFCLEPSRKTQIKNAFSQWAEQRQIKTHDGPPPPRDCIVDIIAYNSNKGDSIAQNGMWYYRLSSDLNAGAGGDFIYFYYAIGKDNKTGEFGPITYLYLTHHSSSRETAAAYGNTLGLHKAGVDLNKGARGHFIYLFISRDKKYGNPVRTILVENHNKKTNVFSYPKISTGYYDVKSSGTFPLDLNKAAGGDYIFLKYTKD